MERTLQPREETIYRLNLGYFLEGSGEWEKATHAYALVLLADPTLANSGFWDEEPRSGRWGDIFEEVLRLSGKDGPACEVAFYRGAHETAVSLAEKVSEAEAGEEAYTRAQHTIARVELAEGRTEDAANRMDALAAATEDHVRINWLRETTYCLLGEAYSQQGREEAAEEYLRLSMFYGTLCPSYALGHLLEGRGEPEKAMHTYHLGFSPHLTQVDVEAALYARLPRHDTLPQLVRIGAGPYTARSWLELARLYENMGQVENAQKVYEVLLAEDPYFEEARGRLEKLKGD
jgi:tetratricopeptide (TPR) repeat protein